MSFLFIAFITLLARVGEILRGLLLSFGKSLMIFFESVTISQKTVLGIVRVYLFCCVKV